MRLRPVIQRRLFRLLYGAGARYYDAFTAWLFLGEWARWQALVLSYLPASGVVLELGCGTGSLARHGSDAGWQWIGLDRSRSMLEVARRQIQGGNPSFILGDGQSLPFANHVFDAIVATFPAPYILDRGTAREMRRVLRSNGHVVILFSAELAGDDWPHRWRRYLLERFYGSAPGAAPSVPRFEGFRQEATEQATTAGHALLIILRPENDGLVYPAG